MLTQEAFLALSQATCTFDGEQLLWVCGDAVFEPLVYQAFSINQCKPKCVIHPDLAPSGCSTSPASPSPPTPSPPAHPPPCTPSPCLIDDILCEGNVHISVSTYQTFLEGGCVRDAEQGLWLCPGGALLADQIYALAASGKCRRLCDQGPSLPCVQTPPCSSSCKSPIYRCPSGATLPVSAVQAAVAGACTHDEHQDLWACEGSMLDEAAHLEASQGDCLLGCVGGPSLPCAACSQPCSQDQYLCPGGVVIPGPAYLAVAAGSCTMDPKQGIWVCGGTALSEEAYHSALGKCTYACSTPSLPCGAPPGASPPGQAQPPSYGGPLPYGGPYALGPVWAQAPGLLPGWVNPGAPTTGAAVSPSTAAAPAFLQPAAAALAPSPAVAGSLTPLPVPPSSIPLPVSPPQSTAPPPPPRKRWPPAGVILGDGSDMVWGPPRRPSRPPPSTGAPSAAPAPSQALAPRTPSGLPLGCTQDKLTCLGATFSGGLIRAARAGGCTMRVSLSLVTCGSYVIDSEDYSLLQHPECILRCALPKDGSAPCGAPAGTGSSASAESSVQASPCEPGRGCIALTLAFSAGNVTGGLGAASGLAAAVAQGDLFTDVQARFLPQICGVLQTGPPGLLKPNLNDPASIYSFCALPYCPSLESQLAY